MTVVLAEGSTSRMVVFPASWLGVSAVPLGDGRYRPVTLSTAMQDSDVVAAIDGPMFANCDAGSSYGNSDCSDPRYALVDRSVGINEPPNRGNTGLGISVSVANGVARWSVGGSVDPDASVGVQLYPSLVENGRVVTVAQSSSNGERVGRAALLGLQDGSLAFITGVASLQDFAFLCKSSGAVWAGYTDGGGSTSLGYRPEGLPLRQWGDASNPRPVSCFLVARRPPMISGDTFVRFALGASIAGISYVAFLYARKRWINSR